MSRQCEDDNGDRCGKDCLPKHDECRAYHRWCISEKGVYCHAMSAWRTTDRWRITIVGETMIGYFPVIVFCISGMFFHPFRNLAAVNSPPA